jgi:hypothetical protein
METPEDRAVLDAVAAVVETHGSERATQILIHALSITLKGENECVRSQHNGWLIQCTPDNREMGWRQ